MPRKCLCVALVAIFALVASRSAHAQVMVDVTKVNCDQFVHHKISEPRLIAAWLSGYYNAKRNNRVIDLQTLEENMSKVNNCPLAEQSQATDTVSNSYGASTRFEASS